jgi:hypothetical protein
MEKKEKTFWKPGNEKPRDRVEARKERAATQKGEKSIKPGLSKSVLTMKVLESSPPPPSPPVE